MRGPRLAVRRACLKVLRPQKEAEASRGIEPRFRTGLFPHRAIVSSGTGDTVSCITLVLVLTGRTVKGPCLFH